MIVIQLSSIFFLLLGLIHGGHGADTGNGNIYAPKPGSAYHGLANAYPSNDFSHHTGESKFNHPRYIPRYTKVGKKFFDVSGSARSVKPGANYDNRLYASYANAGMVPHTEDSRKIKDPNDVHSVNMYTEKLRSHTRKMNQEGSHQREPSNKRKSPSTTTASSKSSMTTASSKKRNKAQ
ncbi:uncharacterized protein FA14DRAFT_160712 [Meira miltonrushii]|uniref:Pal1-domain-containing protein n=1 Tax=Meira miltonrushii TaxID=1280837 RepID=A0A316VDL3_9BASI|nr:uncharacterized protein FA14DRAFT_160712 [Meira miltonrushii]PWN35662.1 hypothetical protein FA14DRAFT_160712 [Meira miltonrushii]